MTDYIHVMPVGDLREHLSQGLECWCQPEQDEEEPRVIVHRSMDGREDFETGRRLPS